ncbi:hypothetical protein TVAGG3_0145520 [Trichomonas vaginalis G3]|uniref:hypothetical protein n=1 Tax=Trichomonas vaginalis (strain ATCC PRA-98 / G3) TaxID=412133 RepID=UPI0021E56961|nr:hypothetical protein TVAGG3_0145520 [Trichomonas vaginalis G3]KAI5546893.1 hypothetical protein TVAGG3_0145520 [Trichomonas vaginalis G3]
MHSNLDNQTQRIFQMKLEYKLQWQNYGQVPTDVQMQTAMSNDAALGLPPWYANMRWKEFYTNPEVGYKQLYADDANTGVDQSMFSTRGRNRMYELQLKNAMELRRKRKRLGGH